jgi:hypothetical protein
MRSIIFGLFAFVTVAAATAVTRTDRMKPEDAICLLSGASCSNSGNAVGGTRENNEWTTRGCKLQRDVKRQ